MYYIVTESAMMRHSTVDAVKQTQLSTSLVSITALCRLLSLPLIVAGRSEEQFLHFIISMRQ